MLAVEQGVNWSAYCTDEVARAQGVRYHRSNCYYSQTALTSFSSEFFMILSEDHSDATYQIQRISGNAVTINNQTYTRSLIISPERLITDWNPVTIDTLSNDDLLIFLELNPEIILLGTGERSVILPAKKLTSLLEKQFHIECMNTAAACRTYTLLIAEGRKVVAGLIL